MNKLRTLLVLCALALGLTASAQVPQLLNYQGRVAVGTTNFNGSGAFKFALVNTNGTTAYWTNDGTHLDGTEPTAAVTLPVTKGLYSVTPRRHHRRQHDRHPRHRVGQCGRASARVVQRRHQRAPNSSLPTSALRQTVTCRMARSVPRPSARAR